MIVMKYGLCFLKKLIANSVDPMIEQGEVNKNMQMKLKKPYWDVLMIKLLSELQTPTVLLKQRFRLLETT
jgi:hypothetical protein